MRHTDRLAGYRAQTKALKGILSGLAVKIQTGQFLLGSHIEGERAELEKALAKLAGTGYSGRFVHDQLLQVNPGPKITAIQSRDGWAILVDQRAVAEDLSYNDAHRIAGSCTTLEEVTAAAKEAHRVTQEAGALAKARAAAYAAVADHEHDLATNPAYKRAHERQLARLEAKALKEGKTADFLKKPNSKT